MKLEIVACIAAAMLLAGPAMAQDKASLNAETVKDLRCVVAISESAAAMEKLAPGSSAMALMYYWGRLDGREPNLDIENALIALSSTMTAKDVSEEDIRCGLLMSQRGKAMQEIGKHMIEHATGAAAPRRERSL